MSQPLNTGKTAGGSVPAPQLQCSLAAAPVVSVSRQDQDLADAEQQPEGSRSAFGVPEVKAHRQALAPQLKPGLKAEPQLQKVEVTVQAQTDQHASTRQALPSTMHPHQQEQLVHSPQKVKLLRLQPQTQQTSVSLAQAPISIPAEGAVQQASQSNAAPASENQNSDAPHCEAPQAQPPIPHDQEMLEASVKQTGLDLVSQMEAANLAVPTVLAECLASNRIKRVPGGDPLEVCRPIFTPCKSCPALGRNINKQLVGRQDLVVICIALLKGDAWTSLLAVSYATALMLQVLHSRLPAKTDNMCSQQYCHSQDRPAQLCPLLRQLLHVMSL